MEYLYFFGLIIILGAVNSEMTNIERNYSQINNNVDSVQHSRSLISNLANSFIPKTGGGSQIISLNLTNLFILLLLKALIYAVGHVGAGAWKGRSVDDVYNNLDYPNITESELLMFMGYLTGKPGDYNCLNLASCKDPKTAISYLNGAKLILNIYNIVDKESEIDKTYSPLLTDLKNAIEYGKQNQNCDLLYKCSMISNN